jgi:DNA-binding LacI/PurR family transcriptional regulator
VFPTRNDPALARLAMAEMFATDDSPTAVIAMSDLTALAALEWLGQRGLRVPDDVSVIGFDGIPESATSVPPLTTIVQPIAEIGRRAVRMILGPDEAGGRELVPVELVVRGSTAPPPRRQ